MRYGKWNTVIHELVPDTDALESDVNSIKTLIS